MLPEPLRLLISAYAAGDLSAGRHKAAMRLLNHSEEARALLADLQSDLDGLRAMPRCLAPDGLADAVLSALPPRVAIVAPILPRPARWQSLITAVAAASVLFAVCAGTWIMLKVVRRPAPAEQGVTQVWPPPHDPLQSKPGESVAATPRAEDSAPKNLPSIPPNVVAEVPAKPTEAPKPPVSPRTELASPPKPSFEPIQVVPPRLPAPFALHSLDQDDAKAKLDQELLKGKTHRIDLFTRDSSRALDRVQAVLRQRGTHVLTDALATEMQKRKLRVFYVIYCDDLAAAEWSDLLRSLGVADRRAEEKRPGDGVLDQLVLMPLAPNDLRDLVSLVGVDPTQPSREARSAKPGGPPSRRPISEGTADQVTSSIGKAEPPKHQKTALVVPFQPLRSSPTGSKEIKQFLDAQGDRQSGTIAVMLVVRVPT